jgi:hypothetical protein
MKRMHKVMIGTGAVLGTLLLGIVWLAHTAIGIFDDTVDTTLDTVRSVENVAQANHSNTPQVDLQPSKTITSQRADKPKAATVPGEPSADSGATGANTADNSRVQKHDADKSGDETDDDFISGVARFAGPLFDNGDGDPLNVTALMRSVDKFDKSDNVEDWLTLVPGGNSPTLKRWREGKYKGNEDQAIEDAIYDPQAWRLASFLGGL